MFPMIWFDRRKFRHNVLLGCRLFLAVFFLLVSGKAALALTPDQVLVLVNVRNAQSSALAEYYMEKRQLPASNLLKLSLDDGETCSREVYDRRVVAPLRRFLEKDDRGHGIRCLVTMYGMPLRVAAPKGDKAQKEQLKVLQERKRFLEKQLKRNDQDPTLVNQLRRELRTKLNRINTLRIQSNKSAALDSELALVLEKDYSLSGWMLNPLSLGYKGGGKEGLPARVLMVSRLDASSPQLVRRMIDDALAVEQNGGLKGWGCIDARYPRPKEEKGKKTDLYHAYDKALYATADMIRRTGAIPVRLNEKSALFQPGDCPDAALYCGWYSLSRYVDAFDWRPGAVGYHIASGECTTLKKADSQVWCKRMIEDGVAATLGPVGEPYLSAFPPPDLFFALLMRGKWTLAECYALSLPFWSWKMVLIGDPLYRPFPGGVKRQLVL